MGRVRVFYGHEGVVPPTGLRSRSAAAPTAPVDPEVDEVVADDLDGAPVELVGEVVEDGDEGDLAPASLEYVDGREVEVGEDGLPVLEAAVPALPDGGWSGPELDSFAEENGIDLTGAKKTKADKLARILETLKES